VNKPPALSNGKSVATARTVGDLRRLLADLPDDFAMRHRGEDGIDLVIFPSSKPWHPHGGTLYLDTLGYLSDDD